MVFSTTALRGSHMSNAHSSTAPPELSNADLARLKFRYRIREVLLDKLVLAVLLGALALYGNWRLKRYEQTLNGELDQLREVYNFQRILAEREFKAHEDAWNALVAFRSVTNAYLGEPMTPESDEKVKAAA